VNENPSRKLTRKIKNEMPITFVDRQLIDSGYAASPFLTKADPSCYQSTVKSGEAALIFSILFFIMAEHDEKHCRCD